MAPESELVIPKLRLEAAGITRKPALRSVSFKDKVFAKVVHPLKSRSKSSLWNAAAYTTEVSTSPRRSYEASRLSHESNKRSSNAPIFEETEEHTEKATATVSLRPRITISPALDALEHESGESLWAIVEVSGEVTLGEIPSKPLEVVTILDCSPYASDNFNQRACQALVDISRLLSNEDRLAIIATCQRHAGDDSSCIAGCIVRPLKPPEPELIENELHCALERRATMRPQHIDVSENLTAAFRILGYAPDQMTAFSAGQTTRDSGSYDENRKNSSRWKNVCSLVIVISRNHAEFYDINGPVAPVPVHVIQPGVIPWRSTEEKHNGWKVSASCLQRNTFSIREELKKLLDHARTASAFGELKDINIEIEAAAGCSILRIIGLKTHKTLHAGEILSVGVLISVPPFRSVDSRADLPFNRSEKNERLICQLESMLGVATQDILCVNVSCEHLPSDTQDLLFEHETLSLNRYDSQSDWLGRTMAEITSSQESRATVAYKRLMLLAARSVPIFEAREAFGKLLPQHRYHSDIETGMRLLEAEIDFQTMVIKQTRMNELEHAQHGSIDAFSNTTRESSFQSTHAPGERSHIMGRKVGLQRISSPSLNFVDFDFESTKDYMSTLSRGQIGHTLSDRSASSNATTIHYDLSEDANDSSHEVEDTARKIWKVMRRSSKSKKHDQQEANFALEGVENCNNKLAIIRRRALQSKRSIGADTLRSLSLDVGMITRDRHAPWL